MNISDQEVLRIIATGLWDDQEGIFYCAEQDRFLLAAWDNRTYPLDSIMYDAALKARAIALYDRRIHAGDVVLFLLGTELEVDHQQQIIEHLAQDRWSEKIEELKTRTYNTRHIELLKTCPVPYEERDEYQSPFFFNPSVINRLGSEHGPTIFSGVNCSDSFYYATADVEEVESEEDIELFRTTLADVMALRGDLSFSVAASYAGLAYAMAKRQIPFTSGRQRQIPDRLRHLFPYTLDQ